ncbi:hypothetical protein BJ322DRAFT_1108390 [Thelephora terrestris]|uniref:Uncharacterized protein n=1 Tax=Thelephora terrestris TaxID=56493 RepID=A0A9P6HGH3_9AGAM|nr:hypothetical protein BJ322DRAFT_1108390 [Thelephora terrestris]
MLCQWSATYCLGDDPARSAQQDYRFPTIIQLDEVAPPPPSSQKSPVPSSSQSYDYYSTSEECEEVEEEEATESYCSSDPSCPEIDMGDSERGSVTTSAPVEQKAKMSRVLAWRSSFDSVFAEDNAGLNFAGFISLKTIESSFSRLVIVVVFAFAPAPSTTTAVWARPYAHLLRLRCFVPVPGGTPTSF